IMTTQAISDALVLFGATGDLAYKQIFPALQALVKNRKLNVPVIGVARGRRSVDELRARVRESLLHHPMGLDRAAFDTLAGLMRYAPIAFTEPNSLHALKGVLDGARAPLHYLAIPPSAFASTIEGLQRAGCITNARVALEKPFGRNLASARQLDATLRAVLP